MIGLKLRTRLTSKKVFVSGHRMAKFFTPEPPEQFFFEFWQFFELVEMVHMLHFIDRL